MAGSPTGITLSLASGEPATFESVNTPLRLDQAAEVRIIRQNLLDGSLDAGSATEQLMSLRRRPRRYPQWTADLGLVVASTGICLILQPGWPNVTFSALAAVLVAGLLRLARRFSLIATLLPALAAFVVGCGLFAAADAGLLDGALRTALPPLAVLLPGALIVTAMSELAAGDMVAGSSRLLFGLVQLMLFTLGLVAASQLIGATPDQLTNMRLPGLGWWAAPAGLVLISIGITLVESPPLRLVPWILGVLSLAMVAQSLGQQVSGMFGSFVGAFAASLGSYLVEAIKPSLPRLVVFLPAFWLLVPGSRGRLSTTQLAVDPARFGFRRRTRGRNHLGFGPGSAGRCRHRPINPRCPTPDPPPIRLTGGTSGVRFAPTVARSRPSHPSGVRLAPTLAQRSRQATTRAWSRAEIGVGPFGPFGRQCARATPIGPRLGRSGDSARKRPFTGLNEPTATDTYSVVPGQPSRGDNPACPWSGSLWTHTGVAGSRYTLVGDEPDQT